MPGGSARREYERRVAKRSDAATAKHRYVGKLLVDLTQEPQSTKAWDQGARGELRVGTRLEKLLSEAGVVLHDRQVPGRRINIDHIVIGPAGVFVVDTKSYKGKVERRTVGPWRSREPHLYIGGRDRTNLLEGVAEQAAHVRQRLDVEIPVQPALCITTAEWGIATSAFVIDGVWIGWAKALAKQVRRTHTLDGDQVRTVATRLAVDFPALRPKNQLS